MFQPRILRTSKNSALFLFTLILTVTYRIFTPSSRLVTVHVIVHRKTSIAHAAIVQTIFVQESCMIPEILLAIIQLTQQQSQISPTPYPATGGGTTSEGPKIHLRHHFAPQRKLRYPKLKYEALESSEVMGIAERSVYKYAVAFGPFESYLFTHCKRCWGPL